MSNLKTVSDDQDFEGRLSSAGNDLVVVDFFTTWCGPCKKMEGTIVSLAMKYPSVLFLKVDADQCFETAMRHNLKGVPLFVLYRNMEILDQLQGAQPQLLDDKILFAEAEHRHRGFARSTDENFLAKQMASLPDVGPVSEVTSFLETTGCRVINDLSPSSFDSFLSGKKLISGKGSGKLLLVYTFKEKLILHSFIIKAKADSGPKVLRFFANHPKILDFQVAGQLAPSQEVTLCPDDLTGERAIELRAGGFNLVTNLQIFIADVMSTTWRPSGYHKVEVDSLKIFGAPVVLKERESVQLPTFSSAASHPNTIGETSVAEQGENVAQENNHSFPQNNDCDPASGACSIEMRKSGPYAEPPLNPREHFMFGSSDTTTTTTKNNYHHDPSAITKAMPPLPVPISTNSGPFSQSSNLQEVITENLKNLRISETLVEEPSAQQPSTKKNALQDTVDNMMTDDIRSFLSEHRRLQGQEVKSKSRQVSKASSVKSNNNANNGHLPNHEYILLPHTKGTVSSMNKQAHPKAKASHQVEKFGPNNHPSGKMGKGKHGKSKVNNKSTW